MGNLSEKDCTRECHPAVYGKCDYDNDKCVGCTPGADDRDCVYLMSYCDAAQKEGRCHEEVLGGLWRMLETNPGFARGEYDVQFANNKMWI